MATVGDQPFCTGHAARKGRRAEAVAHLGRRHDEAEGTAAGRRHRVRLGVQTALRPPGRAPALAIGLPHLSRRFGAVQCIFGHVAPIITACSAPPPEATSTRTHTTLWDDITGNVGSASRVRRHAA
jgi:hypothetical protein